MPLYEYECPDCHHRFDLIKPRSECNLDSECPQCKSAAKRLISGFSHYSASAPNSAVKKRDEMNDKMWTSKRKVADDKIKNPDPLKSWREERVKTLGYGPEKWTEWAKEETTKEQKKKDYGEQYSGRET
jgi:putative FmdB family regulatory protein